MFQPKTTVCMICHGTIKDLSYLPIQAQSLKIIPCEKCYDTIFWNDDIKRATFESTLIAEKKPINPASSQAELCIMHYKERNILCIQDKSLICCECILFGEHKGHPYEKSEENYQKVNKNVNEARFLIQMFDNIYHKFLNEPLKEEKQKACLIVQDFFEELIAKLSKKKQDIIQEIEESYKRKQKTYCQEPQTKKLIEWRKKTGDRINATSNNQIDRIKLFCDFTDELKKISNEFISWVPRITAIKLSGEDQMPLKAESLPQHIQSLSETVDKIFENSRNYKADSQPLIPQIEPVQDPKWINKQVLEQEKKISNNAPLMEDKKDLVAQHFSICLKSPGTVEFKHELSEGQAVAKNKAQFIKYCVNSKVFDLHLELSFPKLDFKVESCLDYLLKNPDMKAIFLTLNDVTFNGNPESKMNKIFGKLSKTDQIKEIFFKVVEPEISENVNSKKKFIVSYLDGLKQLSKLKKFSLDLDIFEINDELFWEICSKISEIIQIREMMLSIKTGSVITDDSIAFLPDLWTNLTNLQKLDVCMRSCQMIHTEQVQGFLDGLINGFKILKEITLDFKDSKNVAIGKLNVPEGWGISFKSQTVIIMKNDFS